MYGFASLEKLQTKINPIEICTDMHLCKKIFLSVHGQSQKKIRPRGGFRVCQIRHRKY